MDKKIWSVLLCLLVVHHVKSVCIWGRSPYDYSEACALQAMRYSSAAYEPILSVLNSWECESCKYTPDVDVLVVLKGNTSQTLGYIARQKSNQSVVILSFRGTQLSDIDSILADVKFTQANWPPNIKDSTVDHGFLQYYLSLEMQIRPVIATLLQDIADPVFVITGHSLGGATAIIAAVSLLDLVSNPVIYTFGGPRVGNLAFVNHVQSQKELTLFRVVHNHDVVVHVPPCTWSLSSSTCDGEGYPRHIPVEVLYNHDMTRYKVCNMQDGEDITCAASFSRISYSIREHLTYFDVNFNNQKAILLPDANQFSTL